GGRLWEYWQKQLAGELPVLNLPNDRPRPPVQTYHGASRSFKLGADLTERLNTLSRGHGVTLFMTLLAAFQLLLSRYTGQEDILVGSPTTGRTKPELAGLIGYFVNPVVLRADLSGELTFETLLSQVRQTVLAAFEHQEYPFNLLVERLQPQRDLSRTPLFQILFTLQKAHLLHDKGLSSFALGETGSRMEFGGLWIESMALDQRVAQFDLALMMAEEGKELAGSLQYNTDLFEERTMARLARHFEVLLAGIVAAPEQRLNEIGMLTAAERHQLLVEWNETREEYPAGETIHQLFEAQVARTPGAVAVICGAEQVSYRELDQRANQLAHYLRRMGVRPEVKVGVLLERSVTMVVALLAVLKAGGAYVPLDPEYPSERLRFTIADAQLAVLLTQAALAEQLAAHEARVVRLDSDWQTIAGESELSPECALRAANLAYVIYTSGSTGVPKGVAIAHQSTKTLIHWAQATFPASALRGVLAATSVCFDLSVVAVSVPNNSGGRVVLAENVLALAELAARESVTLINTVPSAMAELVRQGALPGSVEVVNLAGEALGRGLVEAVYEQLPEGVVYNLYGPSEDTTYSIVALIARGEARAPAIGRPIANTEVYVLDQRGQVTPVGVAGELYIGGAG